MTSTCYMCSAAETSREHAPPQCLFPEESDIGRDLRRNLITVPSCDEHNSKKSADDEFLRAVILLSAVGSNEIARHHFLGKFLRGASRNRATYSNFFTDQGKVASGTQRALRLERSRFDKCIDHVVRALYFHSFRVKWELPLVVVSPNFYSVIAEDQAVPHTPTKQAIELSRVFLGSEPILGENPDVFKYRLRYDPSVNMFAFVGIFYDFFEIYSASSTALAEAAAV
jgi:hypothetical protein